MKRFIYSAGVIGIMQIATLVIMTKIASGIVPSASCLR